MNNLKNHYQIEKIKLYLLNAMLPIFFIAAITLNFSSALAADNETTPLPNSFNHIVKKLMPSMVRVEFTDVGKEDMGSALPFLDNFPMIENEILDFKEFSEKTGDVFKKMLPIDELPFKDLDIKVDIQLLPNNTGNGLIISKDGYVITNHGHSTKISPIVKIHTSDNKVYEGKIVGHDQLSAITLIKIAADEDTEFSFIDLAEKTNIAAGDWVVNIGILPSGNPFLRSALISNISENQNENNFDIGNYYIIDRSIIPELIGSPVINMTGQVIGLSTMQPVELIEPPFDDLEGEVMITEFNNLDMSLIQPISSILKLAEELKIKGKIAHGWLGIQIQNITHDLANALDMKNQYGALVNQVHLDTPAEKSDIKIGDVITMVNGHQIKNIKELSNIVLKLEPGSMADIRIIRSGQELTKNVKIASLPEKMQSPIFINKANDIKRYFLDNYGLRLQKDKDNKVNIKSIKFGSIADRKGLQKGQTIKLANNQQVASVEGLFEIITNLKNNNKKSILILLETKNHFTTFKTLPVK